MFEDGKQYHSTHWWWDQDDNEYEVCAVWLYEKNEPEMPNNWHLQHVEVERYNGQFGVLVHDVEEGDSIWNSVLQDGVPFDAKETEYE